jgi:hypothetical protein
MPVVLSMPSRLMQAFARGGFSSEQERNKLWELQEEFCGRVVQ